MSDTENKPPVRVVVELDNAGVVAAYSNTPVELIVLDHVVTEEDDTISVDGIEVVFYKVDVEVDDDQCQAVLREIDEYEQPSGDDSSSS